MINFVTRRFGVRSALRLTLVTGTALVAFTSPAAAQDAEILKRLEALEQNFAAIKNENATLKEEVARLRAEDIALATAPSVAVAGMKMAAGQDAQVANETDGYAGFVGTSSAYGFRVLDAAVNVNSKPLVQLEAINAGELGSRVTLSGQVTAIANFQKSNRNSKFGYLMRHPTSNNQIGETVSEAVIHSANLAVTGRLTPSVTAYAELLYDPEQSFGAGTITALDRNQIQLRRGWVMWGNLEKRPVYALIGKMDTPFGLNDTVSPFTNSTNWHSFAGLAYGAQVGFYKNGLHLRAMAIQGGSQFRAANTSVAGTSVPSRLNNFALDARYTASFGPNAGDGLMIGASYEHGSPYCQGYPVVHFNPCNDNNPAVAAYGKLNYGPIQLLGEYAQTLDPWPGSAVPIPNNPLSVFEEVKTKSFTLGGRFGFGAETIAEQGREFALSAEFSRFIAGDQGAPWQRQTQIVFGGSWFPVPYLNVFAEAVRANGYVPLNFLSGGNFPDGSTWSEKDAHTTAIVAGVTAAF